MPKVVLTQLKTCEMLMITSITSMVDNGGSTGILRKSMDVYPPGDIRRHILALSEAEEWKKKLWDLRFDKKIFGSSSINHNFGNLFMAGLEQILGDFEKVLEVIHEFMEVKGRCIPATLDKVQLCAKLENGSVIVGEDEIDVPKRHDGRMRITKIWLEPRAKAYPPVIDAIKNADYIIVGPGDIYSSIICCFLPEGISEAIETSSAKKIFLAPLMRKYGETLNMNLEDVVKEVEKYMGERFDHIIYNTRMPAEARVLEHRRIEPLHVEPLKPSGGLDSRFIGADLITRNGPVFHDPAKTRSVLFRLLGVGPNSYKD